MSYDFSNFSRIDDNPWVDQKDPRDWSNNTQSRIIPSPLDEFSHFQTHGSFNNDFTEWNDQNQNLILPSLADETTEAGPSWKKDSPSNGDSPRAQNSNFEPHLEGTDADTESEWKMFDDPLVPKEVDNSLIVCPDLGPLIHIPPGEDGPFFVGSISSRSSSEYIPPHREDSEHSDSVPFWNRRGKNPEISAGKKRTNVLPKSDDDDLDRSFSTDPSKKSFSRSKIKHRSGETLLIQKFVRAHTRILLKEDEIDPTTNVGYRPVFATPQQTLYFVKTKHPRDGPTIDSFKIDITSMTKSGLSSVRSPWNKRLSIVFAHDFVSCGKYGYDSKRLDEIAEAFLVHLKIRMKAFRTVDDDDVSQQVFDQKRINARVARRTGLMTRRVEACEFYQHDPSMKACWELLQTIPDEVCSGDETCHDRGKARYAITRPFWRNPVLHFYFRTLDRLHMSTRFTSIHTLTRGALPHIRVMSERVVGHEDRVPTGLPLNFYADDYLRGLDDWHMQQLQARPAVDLTFSSHIQSLSEQFARVTNIATPPLPRQQNLGNSQG